MSRMDDSKEVYRLELADGTLVADYVVPATSTWARFCGLMFRRELPEGHGICIRPCNSIHMFFMRFAIDVAFVDRNGNVVHVLNTIKPWRMSRMVFKSAAAIELPAGTLAAKGVTKGAKLEMV
jgi:uncharacterized membrane protein (UPF0127 family)